MDKEKLIETIKKSRPNAKDSTLKMYASNLIKLMKIYDKDNLDFLKSPDQLEDKLGKLHYTTRRNYLNSVIVYLMSVKEKRKRI